MTNAKKFNPPYIGIPTLQKSFDLFATRNFSEISAKGLEQRGFSHSVSFQLIQGLKFLGILNEEGRTTDKAKILSMQGSGRKEQLESMLRLAYSKLFNTVPNAETLPKQELHDEFMAVYGLSGRLASTAVPVFLWLCSLAGLKIAETVEIRERSAIHKEAPKSQVQSRKIAPKIGIQSIGDNKSNYSDNSYIDLNIADTGFKLLIPKKPEYESALLDGKLVQVKQSIIDFAKNNSKVEDSVGLAAPAVVDK